MDIVCQLSKLIPKVQCAIVAEWRIDTEVNPPLRLWGELLKAKL
jgi:hypothetical protein